MKKIFLIFVLILILSAGAFLYFKYSAPKKDTMQKQPSQEENRAQSLANFMDIKSSKFGQNQNIPKEYSCMGVNISPPLEFIDVPKEAKSLALIVDDPDAAIGTWVHWLLWNIDPAVAKIDENSVPQGAFQGKTSSGQNIYSGPCPPSGMHHYYFKLYALDQKLNLPSYSEKKDLENAMRGHIIKQAELIGLYSKQ